MEYEYSLAYSQDPATGPHPESDDSISPAHILLSKIIFNIFSIYA